ncbi:hypothetical protein GCM10027416_19820 [Okibacterium endophyticum]
MSKKRKDPGPDPRVFVQVASDPSIGVETTTGDAWIGIDQQVGHGSADALYRLTPEQYAHALVSGWDLRPFIGECWSGKHPELRLHEPGGGRWRPEQWHPARKRPLTPRFAGEIWWHVDALGEPAESRAVALSHALSGGRAATETDDDDAPAEITFPLTGNEPYPRPSGLVAGLSAGSSHADAVAVLGAPTSADPDTFTVESALLRLEFADNGLVAMVLRRAPAASIPGGVLGAFLAAVGGPEHGPAYRVAAAHAGRRRHRWAASSGVRRRLLTFDGGVDMQVEDGYVIGVLIGAPDTGISARLLTALLPDVTAPASRADMHSALGSPTTSASRTDLYRYDRRELTVLYSSATADATLTALTATPSGVSVSSGFHRWRSGEFTTFLDTLGLAASAPLVAYAQGLRGVRVRLSHGTVRSVEIDAPFEGLFDGMPAWPAVVDTPTATEVPISRPYEIDDGHAAWSFAQGELRATISRGTITRMTFEA